jgi:DNA-binding response OmpR family regulator
MGSRVLVVDDDAAVRELVGEYLRGRGVEVEDAGNAATARALLARGGFDVALVALDLPDGGGLDLVRAGAGQVPAVQVVATVAHAPVEDVIAAFRAGAHEALVKPFRLRGLFEVVDAAARARRAGPMVLDLLEAAALAETPEEAEALVPHLVEVVHAALGARLAVGAPGDGRALGARRSAWVEADAPSAVRSAEPWLRAVHAALVRVGR